MKKISGIIIKILAGFILLILIVLFAVPVLFKEQIRTKVEKAITESVKAEVKFTDYNLGFFRNFPNLSFSLQNLSVVGVEKFKSDTLAGFRSLSLVFDLSSLLKKSGYEIKSVVIDRAVVNAIVLKDGSVNWDIMKPSAETPAPAEKEGSSTMKFVLKKVSLVNSSINYTDAESGIKMYAAGLNLLLKGDMTSNGSDLRMLFTIGGFTYVMDGMKYLNNAVVDSKMDFLSDFDKMKFTFRENYFTINDLKFNFSGIVAMPGDNIDTDITFKTAQTSFKTLLSLVPAVYLSNYKDLRTSGEFSLAGSAKGTYSSADSTMPDISLDLSVTNGLISYPALPEKISNINLKSRVFVDGKDMDKTTLGVDLLHMELAGNPFDMTLSLKTPVSDPDFAGSLKGRIDLSALSKAMPMDSISLSGIIDMSVSMAGRMSMIEKEKYESFKASGTVGIRNMLVAMKGYPEVRINSAAFEFTPAWVALTNASLNIGGKSDFTLSGHLANYIPYFLKDKTIRANMSMRSKMIDASEIMSKMASETTTASDTASLAVVKVPKNIDLDFDAVVDEFRYGKIAGQKVKGHILVHEGILTLRETQMNTLGGTIAMNADYDTRDTLKPVMKADFDMLGIGVKDAFNTFVAVQKLAPAAKGIEGKVNAKLAFVSLLGRDMMPVTSSISGEGKLRSDEITLVESQTYNKVKEVLKLGDKYNNTFRDININFKIDKGRIYVKPFDVKTGNLKMNIGGDQGIDQTINYIVKTEMPRSDLGSSVNSFIDNLAAQASSFGISFKPSEVLKINLQVKGTFSKPVITPFFGKAPEEGTKEAGTGTKEAVKQVAGDQAREKGREEAAKLIEDAEAKAAQLKAEASKAAESLKKEAAVQADKLIGESKSRSSLEKLAAQKGAETIRKTADKKAVQIVQEADKQSAKLIEDAKIKSDELLKKP